MYLLTLIYKNLGRHSFLDNSFFVSEVDKIIIIIIYIGLFGKFVRFLSKIQRHSLHIFVHIFNQIHMCRFVPLLFAIFEEASLFRSLRSSSFSALNWWFCSFPKIFFTIQRILWLRNRW